MSQEIFTEDKLEYQFFPVTSGSLHFKVRAANDAHVALTTGPGEGDPMYEVLIGGWGNAKTGIRRNRQKPEKALADTPNVLNGGEYRGFWIRWSGGNLAVGMEGEVTPFITWDDPEPFGIGYYGICTGWGATGSWIIERPNQGPYGTQNMGGYPSWSPAPPPWNAGGQMTGGYPSAQSAAGPGWNLSQNVVPSGGSATWVDASGGSVPPHAVPGGFDNEQLYVARAQHEGALLPGKLVPSHGVCYVPWGGQEHGKPEYQVLVGCEPAWMPAAGGQLPPGALPAGESEDGEPLFVGRANHEGTISIGKVQPSHNVCYIPFGGMEVGYPEYEVMVAK